MLKKLSSDQVATFNIYMFDMCTEQIYNTSNIIQCIEFFSKFDSLSLILFWCMNKYREDILLSNTIIDYSVDTHPSSVT